MFEILKLAIAVFIGCILGVTIMWIVQVGAQSDRDLEDSKKGVGISES